MTSLMVSGVKPCVWRAGNRLQLWKLETFARFINVILQKSLNNSSKVFEESLIEKYVYLTECVLCVCVCIHTYAHMLKRHSGVEWVLLLERIWIWFSAPSSSALLVPSTLEDIATFLGSVTLVLMCAYQHPHSNT